MIEEKSSDHIFSPKTKDGDRHAGHYISKYYSVVYYFTHFV
jgi:hypothetical protein